MMRPLALLALVGCAHAPARVGVQSGEVLARIDDLAREGRADVPTVVVAESGAQEAGTAETIFIDSNVRFAGKDTRISALMLGCGAFTTPGAPPCRFAPASADLFVLRTIDREPPSHDREKDEHAVAHVFGFFSLASLAGMGACIGLCEEHKTGYSIALGGAALVSLVIWAVATGARD